MKTPKIDTSGTERAQRAVAEAQTAANYLQQNFQTDLKNENMTQVVAGGGAEAIPESSTKRRRKGGGLSSQLGISV